MKSVFSMVILSMVIVLFVPGPSRADVYMKRQRNMDAEKMAETGPLPENVMEEVWITRKGLRMDEPGKSLLLFSFPSETVVMDHRNKTFMKKELKPSPSQIQITEGKDPEKSAAVKELGDMMMKIEGFVKVTDETQTIRSWNCRKYLLTLKTFMGEIENEVWATEELKISTKFSDLLAISMICELPGIENNLRDVKSEVRKIAGVPVKMISTWNLLHQSRRSVIELVEFAEITAPADILEVPDGYQEMKPPQGSPSDLNDKQPGGNMRKTALFVFNGDPMCFIHVLLNALDMKAKAHDVRIIIEGAAVKLVPELDKADHPLHILWGKVKDAGLVEGVCRACSKKLEVQAAVQAQGLTLLDDMSGHPSMSGYMDRGYEIITF